MARISLRLGCLLQATSCRGLTWGTVYCALTIWRAKLRWVASKGYLPNSIAYMMTPHDQMSAFCTHLKCSVPVLALSIMQRSVSSAKLSA